MDGQLEVWRGAVVGVVDIVGFRDVTRRRGDGKAAGLRDGGDVDVEPLTGEVSECELWDDGGKQSRTVPCCYLLDVLVQV